MGLDFNRIGNIDEPIVQFLVVIWKRTGTMEFGFNQEIMKVEACVCGNCVESEFLKCLYF